MNVIGLFFWVYRGSGDRAPPVRRPASRLDIAIRRRAIRRRRRRSKKKKMTTGRQARGASAPRGGRRASDEVEASHAHHTKRGAARRGATHSERRNSRVAESTETSSRFAFSSSSACAAAAAALGRHDPRAARGRVHPQLPRQLPRHAAAAGAESPSMAAVSVVPELSAFIFCKNFSCVTCIIFSLPVRYNSGLQQRDRQ